MSSSAGKRDARRMQRPALPGHRALRKGRVSLENQVYLVTVVCRDRRRRFVDFDAACAVSRVLGEPAHWRGASTLAWVLMPDHMHALVELPAGVTLGAVMQSINSRTARAANAAVHGNGPVWEPAFHDHAMRDDENLQMAARYLVANPVRAGLVDRVGDYPFWNAIWIADDSDPIDLHL
jgi:REP element-mobilizing transposase RayT